MRASSAQQGGDVRFTATIGLTLVLLVPGVALGQAAAGGDDAAIRRVIQQHDQTRTSGDWKGSANLFAEDGTTLTSSGEWRRGRAALEKGGAATGAGVYKGAKYATTIDSVRLLAPTVALADGNFEISGIGGGGSRKGHSTYVLVKSGDAWRIAASRSMVPTTVGPTPPR
jgi:uncharacterized protein (TIGR02246 family)